MGEYARWNKKVPKGDGKCKDCGGTGKTAFKGYSTCWSCDGTGQCHQCDGSGLAGKHSREPPHHCTDCANNYEKFNDPHDPFWRNKLLYGDDYVKYL